MKDEPSKPARYRPSIFASPFQKDGDGTAVELLSVAEQDALVDVSRLVSVRRHTVLYPEGGEARFVYNIVSGVAQTYQLLANGERRITAFLFPRDVMGLSMNGAYVATAQSLTPLVAYRIPVDALEAILERDPHLDIGLLCKLCHELRRSQHHTITVSKNDAPARLASFLLWIQRAYADPGRIEGEVTLPMARHDIADYVALSVESVSRALRFLETQGVIRRKGTRLIEVLDPAKLRKLAAQE
ncbi:cyclic nucleotide-binding domain protein [Paraburkholderia xenovorans LB400]|uniref:Transcriptional regulator, Crp/Fnr family n=1 Tax=Paraburkholderia xenovorans (strain LB400) TaxID=266265 RepID=Q13H10_PARXL|nr:Crp/Fnr family transcriptional regulator [Paraburkholderia xenovorans]ABE36629.1 transcriptional regulator, Crp/Fnr family [Paraburkholderia xenovorans LB400]AIP34687.1 cyclic nucleotide-binding domain protein [Paraburkholderia xenovorans LB400]